MSDVLGHFEYEAWADKIPGKSGDPLNMHSSTFQVQKSADFTFLSFDEELSIEIENHKRLPCSM